MKKTLLLIILLISAVSFSQNKRIFSFGGGVNHFVETKEWGSSKNGFGISMTAFNVYVDYGFISDRYDSDLKLNIQSFNAGYTININKGSVLLTPTIGLTEINIETNTYDYILPEKKKYMNVGVVFQARLLKTIYPFIGATTNELFSVLKAGIICKLETK